MRGNQQVRPLEVLYEDNHLLAINKPAGLPTMGVAADRPSVLGIAKEYLKRAYAKPGNVYLGVVSRLDAPVTGVLLMARTSKAASRLSRQFREREVEKVYKAIVEGTFADRSGTLQHWLRKDERHRRMHVTMKDVDTAQMAKLTYRVMKELKSDLSVLEVRLETGRKHQIRVQLSAIGHPIVGDRKYKSSLSFPAGIALHSHQLTFEHPVKRTEIKVVAPKPETWRSLNG